MPLLVQLPGKFLCTLWTLAEKFLRIFSEIVSEIFRILAAFSERPQSNSKKFGKKANEFRIIQSDLEKIPSF